MMPGAASCRMLRMLQVQSDCAAALGWAKLSLPGSMIHPILLQKLQRQLASSLVPHPSRLRLTLICCQLLWLQQQWELLLFLSSSCCSTSFFSLFDCLCVVCALLFALFNSLLVAFLQLLFTYFLSFFWQFLPFISLSVFISLCKSDLAVPLARCDLWPCVYVCI